MITIFLQNSDNSFSSEVFGLWDTLLISQESTNLTCIESYELRIQINLKIPFFAYFTIRSTTAEEERETHLGAFLL